MTIVEKVAEAIEDNEGMNPITIAKVAIEAMRDLVKMTSGGYQSDDIILNEYIDKALKE